MADPAKPIILFNNDLENSGIDSITSEQAGFPKENMLDWKPWTVWRSSGTADQVIILDKGVAGVTIDAFGIDGHNMGTETAQIQVEHDDNAGFASATTAFLQIFSNDDRFFKLFTGSTERYWRITITLLGVSHAEIGLLFLGARYTMPRLPIDGFNLDRQESKGRVNRSRGGNHLGSSVQRADRAVNVNMRFVKESDFPEYRDFHEDHGQLLKPFFFIPDTANHADRSYLVTLEDNPVLDAPTEGLFRHISFDDPGFNSLEVSAGLVFYLKNDW